MKLGDPGRKEPREREDTCHRTRRSASARHATRTADRHTVMPTTAQRPHDHIHTQQPHNAKGTAKAHTVAKRVSSCPLLCARCGVRWAHHIARNKPRGGRPREPWPRLGM